MVSEILYIYISIYMSHDDICIYVVTLPLPSDARCSFAEVIGPEAKLTRERMRLEVQVYGEWMHAGWNLLR